MLCRRGKIIDVSSLMRLLAKNRKARFLWNVSKQTTIPLFDGVVAEWSSGRLMFCQWCMYYDSIYEAHNRPPEHVIKDDKKIDEWAKFTAEQMEFEHEENYRTTAFKDKQQHRSAYSYPEVFEFE